MDGENGRRGERDRREEGRKERQWSVERERVADKCIEITE